MRINNSKKVTLGICVATILFLGTAFGAPPPLVEEIVERTELAAYYQGDDGHAQVEMTITDGQGRKRVRRLTILRRDQQGKSDKIQVGEQKYYVHIELPTDLRHTVFTVWKKGKKDDDRWLYLPALDLVRRIAAGDKRTAFLGSDFFYEDISGRSTELDSHELLEISNNYFVVKNTPKSPGNVEFSHYKMWIHKRTFIPVKVKFYDKQGDPYRIYEALAVETVQGYPTVMKSRMQDLRDKSETVLVFDRVKYNVGIPNAIFEEQYLRNPPKQYLH
ncbi:MAG: outer membrane lipoprotein-sorting protein [Methylococcales bacterium]|nr:outer membrane lipoprotein-sorting protein [Methylococcales bacterium]